MANNFKSKRQIVGPNNNIFSLSKIKNEYVTEGDPKTNIALSSIEWSGINIRAYLNSLSIGNSKQLFFAGSSYCLVTRLEDVNNYPNYKFEYCDYDGTVNDSITHTYTNGTDMSKTYLGLIVDEDNLKAKPVFITKNNNMTSFNQETYTDEFMTNYFSWLGRNYSEDNFEETYYFKIILKDNNGNKFVTDAVSYQRKVALGLFNCFGVDVANEIKRDNCSVYNGSYGIDNIVQSSDSDGPYWGNSSLAYSNASWGSKIAFNTSEWSKLVAEIECIGGGGANARFNIVACEKTFTKYSNLWDGTYCRTAGKAQSTIISPLTRYEIDLTQFTKDKFYIALDTSDCQIRCRRLWLEK